MASTLVRIDSAAKSEKLLSWQRAGALQQDEVFNIHPMWKAIHEGNWKEIKALTTLLVPDPQTGEPVRQGLLRGVEGETVLHAAILLRRPYEIVENLVKTFPELVNEPYAGDKYLGETALHLAVVQTCNETFNDPNVPNVVKLLIEHGALTDVSKARGREFDFLKNGSLCYYGQTVLHFACMTGKANIVEYLIDNNADVNEVTELTGNNVLHLLAQAKGMETQTFKRIFQLLKTRDPTMLQQKNNKMDDEKHPGDMTPFELGVFEQNANILEGIKQILWDFDKTVQYLVPLNELDPLLRSNQDDKLSLIELAVKNNDKDILSHPVIETILKWKWKMYAQYIFLGRFLVTFFLVAVVYTPVISLQPSNYDQRRGYGNFTDGWEVFRLIWELLAVFGALILLFWTAFNDAVIKSWKVLNELNRWEYINRWAFSLFILSIPLTRVLGQIPGVNETAMLNAENVLFTFGAIAGWIYLLDFAKGSEHIGPLIVVVWKIVTRDLLQWLWIFIPVCMGFASGFFLQMQDVPIETSSVKDWDQFIGAAVWTVRFLFGQAAYDDFRAAKMPWFTYTMFIIYGFIAVILLVNVLIGKVVDTFTNVNADSERVWRVELGALIMSIDMHLSSKAKQRYRENFGLTSMAAGREGIRYFQFTEHCVKFRNGESTVMEVLVKRDLKDDGSVDERVWKAKELENWHDFRAGFFEILKRVMWGESLIGLADDKRKW